MDNPSNHFPDEWERAQRDEEKPLIKALPLKPLEANQKQLDILKKSVPDWNWWREKHDDIWPVLQGAGLSRANLSNTDLSSTLQLHFQPEQQ